MTSVRITKFLAGPLALVYFMTNVALASAPESGFWADRRKAGRSHSEGSLASAEGILGGFPVVSRSLSQTLPTSAAEGLPAGFTREHASLFSALPAQWGSIRKVSLPTGPVHGASRVVVHIQDVHMNAQAQRNIAGAVQSLMENKAAGLVALEGAFGPIDLGGFRSFPGRDAVRKAADWLLGQNKISGPVHAAFACPSDIPPIAGVDDRAHYDANVQAYRRSAAVAPGIKSALSADAARVAREKEKTFSPGLQAFDREVQSYREGKSSLGAHVRALALGAARTPLHAGTFIRALDMESALDFNRVEAERTRLVERLMERLSRPELDGLLRKSLAYRMGRVRAAEFYRDLRALCLGGGVPLSQFPALDAYVRYVLLSDGISAEGLLEEVSSMETAGYARLAASPAEKALLAESKRLSLTGKLLDFALSPAEWAEYESLRPLPASRRDLSSFEDFYREARARDRAMADSLLAEMTSRGAGAAVLVTGGYHAPGLTERLTRAGCVVVSFVPKIEKIDTAQGSAYLSMFTREKTPLERLFQGQKLFLAMEPAPQAALGEAALLVAAQEEWRKKFADRARAYLNLKKVAPGFADAVELETASLGEKRVELRLRFRKEGSEVRSLSVQVDLDGDGNIAGFKGTPVRELRDQLGAQYERLVSQCRTLAGEASSLVAVAPWAELPFFRSMAGKDWLPLLALHDNQSLAHVALRLVGMVGMELAEEAAAPFGPDARDRANVLAHEAYNALFGADAPLSVSKEGPDEPILDIARIAGGTEPLVQAVREKARLVGRIGAEVSEALGPEAVEDILGGNFPPEFAKWQAGHFWRLVEGNRAVIEMFELILSEADEEKRLALFQSVSDDLESVRVWAKLYFFLGERGVPGLSGLWVFGQPLSWDEFNSTAHESLELDRWMSGPLESHPAVFGSEEERNDNLERARIAVRSFSHDQWNDLPSRLSSLKVIFAKDDPMAPRFNGLLERVYKASRLRRSRTFADQELFELVQALRLLRDMASRMDVPQAMLGEKISALDILDDRLSFIEGDISSRVQSFPLGETVHAAFQSVFAGGQPENIDLDMSGLEGVMMRGDPAKIRALFRTLFTNSVQVWRERHEEGLVGPRVKIQVRMDMDGATPTFSFIEVVDDVGGISEEHLLEESSPGRQRAFELNVSRRKGDTGLGLAQVWWLAKLHGKGVSVRFDNIFDDSGARKGAKFTLAFPRNMFSKGGPVSPAAPSEGDRTDDTPPRPGNPASLPYLIAKLLNVDEAAAVRWGRSGYLMEMAFFGVGGLDRIFKWDLPFINDQAWGAVLPGVSAAWFALHVSLLLLLHFAPPKKWIALDKDELKESMVIYALIFLLGYGASPLIPWRWPAAVLVGAAVILQLLIDELFFLARGVREVPFKDDPSRELLSALGLEGPASLAGEERVEDFGALGRAKILRVRIPARSDPGSFPKGRGILQNELNSARNLWMLRKDPSLDALDLDILMDSNGRAVALLPVHSPDETKRNDEGLRDGGLDRDSLKKYIDVSPYHFKPIVVSGSDAAEKWTAFQAEWRRDQELIEAYKARHYGGWGEFVKKAGMSKYYPDADGDDWTEHHAPFCLLGIDAAGGISMEKISPTDAFPHGKEQGFSVIVPKFPTVYPPYGHNASMDRHYYDVISALPVKESDDVLVIGPGVGPEAVLFGRRTRRPVAIDGLNPLEVANTRVSAGAAGVAVKEGAGLLDTFDYILWNMPAFSNAAKNKKERGPLNLQEIWDGDVGGVALDHLAKQVKEHLAEDGLSVVWNAPTQGPWAGDDDPRRSNAVVSRELRARLGDDFEVALIGGGPFQRGVFGIYRKTSPPAGEKFRKLNQRYPSGAGMPRSFASQAAHADAARTVRMLQGRGSRDDFRDLLVPPEEPTGVGEPLRSSPGYAAAYREVLRSMLRKAGWSGTAGDAFGALLGSGTSSPPQEGTQVLELDVALESIADAAAIVASARRDKGRSVIIRLVPAEPVPLKRRMLRSSLEKLAGADPNVVVREPADVTAEGLDRDFELWRRQRGLLDAPLRLAIGVLKGVDLGEPKGNSLYAQALRAALSVHLRPVDFIRLLDIAHIISEAA